MTKTTTAIVKPSAPLATVNDANPLAQLLEAAVDKNLPVESMEKLVALYERVADRQAASDFAAAMAAFQAECPPIPKTSTAKIATTSGANYSYTYAELDEIAKVIGPALHGRGLSYSWDSTVTDGQLVCTCTVRHANGHSQPASFACPIDDRAKMSEPQKYAAALTYARRQSLIQALGLTTTDGDSDGADLDERIGPGQIKTIESLIDDSGADVVRFLKFVNVDRIEDIRTGDHYESAVSMLEGKLRIKQGKSA